MSFVLPARSQKQLAFQNQSQEKSQEIWFLRKNNTVFPVIRNRIRVALAEDLRWDIALTLKRQKPFYEAKSMNNPFELLAAIVST